MKRSFTARDSAKIRPTRGCKKNISARRNPSNAASARVSAAGEQRPRSGVEKRQPPRRGAFIRRPAGPRTSPARHGRDACCEQIPAQTPQRLLAARLAVVRPEKKAFGPVQHTAELAHSGPRSPTSAQPAASATKTAAALLPLVSRLTPAGDMGLSVGNCRRLHPLQRRPDPSGNGPASRSPGTKNRKRVNV